MKITLNKLQQFVELQYAIEEAAVEIGKIQETWPKFEQHDIESLDVELGKKQVDVWGRVGMGQCGDEYFSIVIPFTYFEDPVKWEDDYREEQHVKLLEKIEDRKLKEINEAAAIERGERKLLADLKEKYG